MFIRTRTVVRELGQEYLSSALRSADSLVLLVSGKPQPFPHSRSQRRSDHGRPEQSRACALERSARRRGEDDAGSVTSPSFAISIRGHVGLPGVSDRAFYAAFSATCWSSASCHRPQPPTPLLALPFLVAFLPNR